MDRGKKSVNLLLLHDVSRDVPSFDRSSALEKSRVFFFFLFFSFLSSFFSSLARIQGRPIVPRLSQMSLSRDDLRARELKRELSRFVAEPSRFVFTRDYFTHSLIYLW